MKKRLVITVILVGVLFLTACTKEQTSTNTNANAAREANTNAAGQSNPSLERSNLTTSNPNCDEGLLQHVYKPQRLILKNKCVAVTGTIVDATANQSKHEPDGVRHERDGDSHGWLKVDSQFQNLLNAGNASDEGGNLVFEIVCEFPVTQQDAVSACQVIRTG